MNILTVLKRATRKTKSSTQQSGILKAIPSEVTEWIVDNIGSKITSVDFSRLNDHWLSRGLFTWRLKWIKKWRVTGQGLAIGELACDVYYYHYYNYHHYHHHHHHHHYIIIIIKAALSNCRTNRKGTPIKQRSRECCLCGQDKDTVGCSASLCQFFFIFAKTGSFDHFRFNWNAEILNVISTVAFLKSAWRKQLAACTIFESIWIYVYQTVLLFKVSYHWDSNYARLRWVGLLFFVELVNLLNQARQCTRAIHCA